MVGRARKSQVVDLLNECQKSPAAHSRSAKLLWELALEEPELCLEEVCHCLKHVLLIEEVVHALNELQEQLPRDFNTVHVPLGPAVSAWW